MNTFREWLKTITITKEVHPNVDISDIENKTKYKPKKQTLEVYFNLPNTQKIKLIYIFI